MLEASKNLYVNTWTDREEARELFGGENRVKFFETPRTGLFGGLFIEILDEGEESVLPDLPWIIKLPAGRESEVKFRIREYASVGGGIVNIVHPDHVKLEI